MWSGNAPLLTLFLPPFKSFCKSPPLPGRVCSGDRERGPGGEGPPLTDLRQSQMSLPQRHPAPHRHPQAVGKPGIVSNVPNPYPSRREAVPHLARLVRRGATDEEEVGLGGEHLEALLGQHSCPLGTAGDDDPDPALLL